MGYLSVQGVEAGISSLASSYPNVFTSITLPETSVEGRTSHALKIAAGPSGPNRRGVLFLGGVHARELVNPDMLIMLGIKLCQSYVNNTDLVLGNKTYTAGVVKLLVEGLDIFFFPLVNPDGRAYVQAPNGDAMWRKNRRHNSGTCYGVDINRNFDLLWSSGIGTSSDPCDYQIYKGPSAFSEPETRNVRWMLDTYPQIQSMLDVHSFSNDYLYPWGDATDQSTDPNQNFQNHAYDGLRGVPNSAQYKEYTPSQDLWWFQTSGNALVQAIAGVRGTTYTSKQSIGLYPTSGTSDDYAYSRHFVDTGKTRVYGATLETGSAADYFQPPFPEAQQVMYDGAAGVMQFLIESFCLISATLQGTAQERRLAAMREFRDRHVLTTAGGMRYVATLQQHTDELMQLIAADDSLRGRAAEVLSRVHDAAEAGKPVDDATLEAARKLAEEVSGKGSPALREALQHAAADIPHFRGRPIPDVLKELGAVKQPVG